MTHSFALRAALTLVLGFTFAASQMLKAGPPAGAHTADVIRGREAIQKALDEKVSLEFVETPLADIAVQLSERYKINVQIEKNALEDSGVQTDQKITVKLKDLTFRSALRHLLAELELSYVVDDDMLLVTTPEKEYSTLVTRVYLAPEITAVKAVERWPELGGAQLISVMQNVLAPQSWEPAGGPGAASAVVPTLIVSQTESIHESIGPLLAALKASLAHKEQATGILVEAPLAAEARKRIEKALATPVDLDFERMPLADIMEQVESRYGVPVWLDKKALENGGVQTDQQLTLHVKNVPLGSALSRLLNQLELYYFIRDERLVVTTPEVADAELEIRVYMVGPPFDSDRLSSDKDWFQAHPAKQGVPTPAWHVSTYRGLYEAIITNVAPTTWNDAGGPGSMSIYEPGCSLVIRQTRLGHEQIADVLAQLKKATGEEKAAATAAAPGASVAKPEGKPVDASGLITRTYSLHDEIATPSGEPGGTKPATDVAKAESAKKENRSPTPDKHAATAEELAAAIMQFVEPESWKNGTAHIRAIGGKIVVCHTFAVHQQIEKFLSSLEAPPPSIPRGFGTRDSPQTAGSGFGGGGGFFALPVPSTEGTALPRNPMNASGPTVPAAPGTTGNPQP